MSALSSSLEDYLSMRRQVGYEVTELGRFLSRFVDFAEQQGADFITTELAVRWATLPKQVHQGRWAQRLGQIRGFARYLSAFDQRTQVPPKGVLPHRYPRRTPYVYSDTAIGQLLEAARALPSRNGLRSWTYSTALGLYVVTGMRLRELLGLDRTDVDLGQGLLTVRRSKFGKSRLLPVHPKTVEVLQSYAQERDRIYPRPRSSGFFLSQRGTRLAAGALEKTFRQLCSRLALRRPADRIKPHIHDLRHRFAIETLCNWYRTGVDVESRLLHLATYLGHARVHNTYWYLSATPELLELARTRRDHLAGGNDDLATPFSPAS